MLHILILMVTLAVATAVPSRELHEEPALVDLRYGGPSGILRFIDEHADSKDHGMAPDIEEQKKIIEKTYSPAFLQPIWILDYRLTPLKGRHYKITLGNHVVILPKDNRQHGPDVHYFEDDKHRDDGHHRNENAQEIELKPLRHLGVDDKHDRSRDGHHRNEHAQEVELNRLRHLSVDDKHDRSRDGHHRNEHSQEVELNRLRHLSVDDKHDRSRDGHHRNEHSQEVELNRLRHLSVDDKHDRSRDGHHRNEHSQEVELNRLRHLSVDDKHNRRRVVNNDDEREHAPHHGWGKEYNPGWAVLPNVKFAGRNHH